MRTLRLSWPDGRPMTMSALARSVMGPASGQRICASVTGCQRATQRREALDELRDPGDRTAAHVGLVAGVQRRQPLAEAAVVAGEASDGVVDEVARRRLATPVEQQLDRAVRHLAAGERGRPRERRRRQEVRLTGQHLGDVELVDGERSAIRRVVASARRCRPPHRDGSSATKPASNTSGSSSVRRSASSVRCCAGVSMGSTVRHGCHSALSWPDAPSAHPRTPVRTIDACRARPRPGSPTPRAP